MLRHDLVRRSHRLALARQCRRWRRRRLRRLLGRRRRVLIVIDEAHNVCPSNPESGMVSLATRHAIQIAAEGRKFGLHLLLSTQRPQKVHDNVLSQCDNLMLMRMNSTADLAHLAETFSFVPPTMLDAARHFGLGEALVAGKISPHPTLIRFAFRNFPIPQLHPHAEQAAEAAEAAAAQDKFW